VSELDVPPDDAFVRTAIRGMQTPDHHPDFWDDLASLIDASEGPVVDAGLDLALGAPRDFEMPVGPTPRGRRVHARPAHRAGDHAPRRAPLRAGPVAHAHAVAADAEFYVDRERDLDPDPGPDVDLDPALEPAPASRQVHIAAPTAAVPAAAAARTPEPEAPASSSVFATAAAAAAPARAVRRVADPLSKLKIEHDAATMPFSMRRTSNIVLLTVALAAVMIAVFAGLSLVRQRSDSGAPAPLEHVAA
jgi:hypothetical protein